MISLYVLFWVFIFVFAFIGTVRQRHKELLVIPAVVTALLLIILLETFIPYLREGLTTRSSFWFRIAVLTSLSVAGYLAPNFIQKIKPLKIRRKRLDDILFGFIFGAINGYLIIGSAWYFLVDAGYPFAWVTAPEQVTAAGQNTSRLIELLPPQWLGTPIIYFATAVSIILAMVV